MWKGPCLARRAKSQMCPKCARTMSSFLNALQATAQNNRWRHAVYGLIKVVCQEPLRTESSRGQPKVKGHLASRMHQDSIDGAGLHSETCPSLSAHTCFQEFPCRPNAGGSMQVGTKGQEASKHQLVEIEF